MPVAVTDEQMAMAESVGRWASRAGAIAVVRGLEARAGRLGGQPAAAGVPGGHGAAAGLWAGLDELGVFAIAVPEASGGAGGAIADVAVVVEQLAAGLVPGPVLPTLLAGLLLARFTPPGSAMTGPAAAEVLLTDVASGAASVAVALSTGSLAGTCSADGSVRVSGTVRLVLGGGDTSHLLAGATTGSGEAWFVLPVGHPGVQVTHRNPVDFSRSLADISLTEVDVRPGQQLAGLRTSQVRDLAATLATAEAAGIAAWCSQTGAAYARNRRQFGRPIGAFQAVKHLCAGMLCRAELTAAAAWDAACAADEAPDELPLAAAAAASVALDAAVDNAKDCIQVLGGIGFTWEHDAHLYLRRALGLRQLLGGSAPWRARAAALALSGRRRRVRDNGPSRFNGSQGDDDVRSAARAAAVRILALPPDRQRSALADSGYAAPHWPVPFGLSASGPAQLVIDQELASAGLARPDLSIGGWAVPAVLGHGTPAQHQRFAGPTLRGEITWCQLFSEPEAGSDLASLRTRAVRTDGGWLLTGQKVWTSLAMQADWAICLARTDPEAPKHKGITFFLVSMDSPGIDIRPLREMTGREMFNEVFLDDVFVPDECVVGEPGAGWRIARATLATERVAMGRGAALGEEVEDLLAAIAAGDVAAQDVSSAGAGAGAGSGSADAGPAAAGSAAAGSGEAGSGAGGSAVGGSGRAGPGEAGPGAAGSAVAGSGEAGSGQAGPRQAGPRQAGSGAAGSAVAGSGRAGPGAAGSGVGGPGEAGSEEARSGAAGSWSAGSVGAGLADVTTAGVSLDSTVLDQLGARIAEGLALSAMDDRLARAVLRGADPGFQAAVRKLLGVAHRQAVAETALTLCGADGAAADGAGADAVHQFLLSRCLSIAGGTSQILMSLVAERVLGLPREEVR